jgi:outer membrane receptor protein involved in Fe transport
VPNRASALEIIARYAPGAVPGPSVPTATVIAQATTLLQTSSNGFLGGVQAGSIQNLAGNIQIVPGTGVSGAASALLGNNAPAVGNPATLPANTFTRFAPSTLPAGTTAAQVIAALAPGFVAPPGATPAQLDTLAINLLQANRPTPREYLAQNPNTPINAFLGSFIPAFLDVANPDPASAQFLPRTAVPLQFDGTGALITTVPGRFDATTPATTGGIPGGDFYNSTRYVVLRTQQDRFVANLFGKFDVADALTFYTENLYARVENEALRNVASSNQLGSGGTENALIVASINNPYLSAAARQTLVNAGVSATNGLFALSRTNQDITGDNRAFTKSDTYRTVNGLRGDFRMFGRPFSYDGSFTYGRVEATVGTTNIRDVEYALALDAVVDPANPSRIVCRVQTPGASTALPLGVSNVALVREPGADGVLVERVVPRVVTADQIARCQPLNPFGFNQMSNASKDYVTFLGVATNSSEQMFLQGSLATGDLFRLPGGPVGVAINAEWRRDTLDYRPSAEQRLGVSRTAALAATQGEVTSVEASAEARIPIFGPELNIPLMHSLDFTPGVRFVRQDGDAPDVLRLNGVLETNEAEGEWETLYTLGGTWRPFPDLQIRGNYTRSIRQPSVVELFLGNQPAFNTPTDPCDNRQIASGNVPATRRANCEQEVVRLGLAPDRAAAANFLSTFVSAGQALQGGFAGSPGLLPEKGRSWTVGGVLSPHFVPGLTVSADYIDVEVRNQIIPTTLSNAAQFCYDSATFGSTESTLGVNTCDFFSREGTTTGSIPAFNIQNGFASGFINLGALKVRAVNANADYNFNINDVFGGQDVGRLSFKLAVYHLIDYITSAAGDFTDNQNSAGSFFRPKWEAQFTTRYEREGFFLQGTWNWQDKTRFYDVNVQNFATIEQRDVFRFPAFSVFDASVGFSIEEQFEVQLTVRNLTDNRYAGLGGFASGIGAVGNSGEIDLQGRRFSLTARARF